MLEIMERLHERGAWAEAYITSYNIDMPKVEKAAQEYLDRLSREKNAFCTIALDERPSIEPRPKYGSSCLVVTSFCSPGNDKDPAGCVARWQAAFLCVVERIMIEVSENCVLVRYYDHIDDPKSPEDCYIMRRSSDKSKRKIGTW